MNCTGKKQFKENPSCTVLGSSGLGNRKAKNCLILDAEDLSTGSYYIVCSQWCWTKGEGYECSWRSGGFFIVVDQTMLCLKSVVSHAAHDSRRSVLADYSTSEMLVNMGNLPLDEFYPAVSMVALMRIFRDQSLSHHHTMVVQAITFIFKSLGLKCVQFLPQVMPTFLNVIRVCDGAIREVSS